MRMFKAAMVSYNNPRKEFRFSGPAGITGHSLP
jgi:hypothetical protein